MVSTDVSPRDDRSFFVAVQPDLKVVVCGSGFGNGLPTQIDVVRYNADGSLDTSVGTGGKLIIANAQPTGFGEGLAIQADGNTTFGINGFSPPSSQVADWNPFVIQPDDKIVAGCHPLISGSADDHTWVMRVLADGTAADSTFGQGGFAEANFGVNTVTRGIAVGPDGKIVVASNQTTLWPGQFRLARFLGDSPPVAPLAASLARVRPASPTAAASLPHTAAVPLVPAGPTFLRSLGSGKRRHA